MRALASNILQVVLQCETSFELSEPNCIIRSIYSAQQHQTSAIKEHHPVRIKALVLHQQPHPAPQEEMHQSQSFIRQQSVRQQGTNSLWIALYATHLPYNFYNFFVLFFFVYFSLHFFVPFSDCGFIAQRRSLTIAICKQRQ